MIEENFINILSKMCLEMSFWKFATIFNLQVGKSFNESKICNNSMDFTRMKQAELKTLMNFVYNNSIKCVKPCNTVSYEVSLQKLNKNAVLVSGNGKPQVVIMCIEFFSFEVSYMIIKWEYIPLEGKHITRSSNVLNWVCLFVCLLFGVGFVTQ